MKSWAGRVRIFFNLSKNCANEICACKRHKRTRKKRTRKKKKSETSSREFSFIIVMCSCRWVRYSPGSLLNLVSSGQTDGRKDLLCKDKNLSLHRVALFAWVARELTTTPYSYHVKFNLQNKLNSIIGPSPVSMLQFAAYTGYSRAYSAELNHYRDFRIYRLVADARGGFQCQW